VTVPATPAEWIIGAFALGVLAGATVLIGGIGEHGASELVLRTVAAFALGLVVGAAWWAVTWLRAHGVRGPTIEDRR